MYMFLDLSHHPFRQPLKSGGICNHCRNLDLTSINTIRLSLPVSIFFERAVFDDSYRRIANPI